MFSRKTYLLRRAALKRQMSSGLLLLLGNEESPMNYRANAYPFRQDSTFLYLFGLDRPGLNALVDVDEDRAVLFGDDPSLGDVVWTGPQPSLEEQARAAGVTETAPAAQLAEKVPAALRQGRTIHFLPPYRAEHRMRLERLLGIRAAHTDAYASRPLIEAVVAQRSVKSDEEVAEIEAALAVSCEMHTAAMRAARPGMLEQEVVGTVEGIMRRHGRRFSFAPILSVHGEILHSEGHAHRMEAGDLVVHDSGAASPRHYASDITRTFPVGGRFSEQQREVYEVVLRAQEQAIEAVRPGVPYKEVHLLASRVLAEGLKELGLMRGDVEEAVAAGAHALFFPHGLGHLLGLDVHDMEGLGEDFVGYDAAVRRSDQFGLAHLRLGRALQPGFVLTVEPGLYFIPALIDQWKADRTCEAFIDYDRVEAYRGFGGIRIEDDVLVTEEGRRVLGRSIPKSAADVEAAAAGEA